MLILSQAQLLGLLPPLEMIAAALTAQRTGAVGALGVKYMTPETVHNLGIVGCGVQGAWQAIYACALRPIREVFGVARSAARFEAFASRQPVPVSGPFATPQWSIAFT